ncbi:MAG: hypothetical protein A3A80_02695 [Candidatus Terrybacteria bacterium RIFCSPLOWO2_01_FULL_44_24]|uniref:Uncharacterized protein n=1 Tax=Candidatus Terrybacteria bacterium RIFCSPHIGHO2_01_FULL_43_35 TaxID=1802361 RepID=A0A1G2PG47_9BACT|nr:MAG: hypothetical protein A2828_02485 [Candidatus Terrybacteria bacterium RIFCSPHIGHO2_01_FULL_43_35]OHA50271.1 MAG: hypothetical protein A3B75_00510 [Candidatus Terrybacteria bacterium RIFCSPHIGHO2_02_FULL_43_14]OHA50977.1 MAG: hypothetical protein A3A80_02695 [Candidatus Terrybacteria bacterium RIFCSPLOWO2_01_FULL_44_24]
MGLFNNPPQGVTKEEFRRIMNGTHNLPQEARKRLEDLGEAYFTRQGIYNRIRKEDFEQFMKGAKDMLPPGYHDKMKEMGAKLQAALRGHYGS